MFIICFNDVMFMCYGNCLLSDHIFKTNVILPIFSH